MGGFPSYLLDHGKDPGFGIVISVCSDAQIDFLLERILPVGCHQPKKRVFWRLRNSIRGEDRGITTVLHVAFDVCKSGG